MKFYSFAKVYFNKSEGTRRNFINLFLSSSVGALFTILLYPVFRYISPPLKQNKAIKGVDAGKTNEHSFLEKGYKIIQYGMNPVIVIRLSEFEFRAFSATCTHLDCIVEYEKKGGRIICNCHNGEYDLHGKNILGPPPKPLTSFKIDILSHGTSKPGSVIVSRAL